MRNVKCLLRKAPDLISRLGAIESVLPVHVLAPLQSFGDELRSGSTLPERLLVDDGEAARGCSRMPLHSFDAAVVRRARVHFSAFDFLCPSVQHVLLSLSSVMSDFQLQHMSGFQSAIAARRFRLAARIIKTARVCIASLVVDCEQIAMALDAGCSVHAATWLRVPAWSPTGYTQSDGGGGRLSVVLRSVEVGATPSAIGATSLYAVTVAFDLSIGITAVAACSSVATATLEAQLSQQHMQMVFYKASAAAPSEEAVNSTVAALVVMPDGLVAVSASAERWWQYHSSLFVDAAAVISLQPSAGVTCAKAARQTDPSAPVSVSLSLTPHKPLVRVARVPAKQTLALAGLSARPSAVSDAISAVCLSQCPRNLALESLGQTVHRQDASLQHINSSAVLRSCLEFLAQDYAACEMSKLSADRRLRRCMNATEVDVDMAAWLTTLLDSIEASAYERRISLSKIDCHAFTTAKARHCACARSTIALEPSMRNVQHSVGPRQDVRATNLPMDLMAVQERLSSLGYGRATFSSAPPAESCDAELPSKSPFKTGAAKAFVSAALQEHLTRVFLCAVAGEVTFEDPCDVLRVNGFCAVNGRVCPLARRTSRETCLRDAVCAQGFVDASSAEFDWLRARDAPKWVKLPEAGAGYVMASGSAPFAFATSWVLDRLQSAGRMYSMDHMRENAGAIASDGPAAPYGPPRE
jgi:hypothetical protein